MAGGGYGKATAHSDTLPQRGNRHAHRRRRRRNLLDSHVLDVHRLPRHTQCDGIRTTIYKRHRG